LSRPAAPHEGRHPLPEAAAFTATLARLGITRDSLVVAYDDQSGAIAARLWWMLQWIGHPHCRLLDGGLQAWTAAGLPLDKGPVVPHAAAYPPCIPDDSLIVTTEEMLEFSGVLLDARAAARFRGEMEPIDPVAGHIPGAQNLPFAELLDADGCFLAAAALEQRIARALPRAADEDETSIVAMCGSGVTACHLIAGLAMTGRRSRLYVGSWSEWIRDPQRPVANVD